MASLGDPSDGDLSDGDLSDGDLDTVLDACLALRLYSPPLLQRAADRAVSRRPDRRLPLAAALRTASFRHASLAAAVAATAPSAAEDAVTWLRCIAEEGVVPVDGKAERNGVAAVDGIAAREGVAAVDVAAAVQRLVPPTDLGEMS